jgi:hypothetical protein
MEHLTLTAFRDFAAASLGFDSQNIRVSITFRSARQKGCRIDPTREVLTNGGHVTRQLWALFYGVCTTR